jgi:hypothetical protein
MSDKDEYTCFTKKEIEYFCKLAQQEVIDKAKIIFTQEDYIKFLESLK